MVKGRCTRMSKIQFLFSGHLFATNELFKSSSLKREARITPFTGSSYFGLFIFISGFELWCWRTLESPLDCKEIKPVHPEYSLEGLMLNLKLQSFGHLMWRTDPFGKTMMWERLKGGGEGDDRGWDGWMESPTQWTWVWVGSGSWWCTGRRGVLQSMGSQRLGQDWATELNWYWFLHKRHWRY